MEVAMLSSFIFLLACGEKEPDVPVIVDDSDTDTNTPDCDRDIDPDCDGFTEADGDCDPNDGLVYPGATEIPYDGKDNDCAGDGDWNDVDEDGFVGASAGGDDCDDSNPEVYPGAEEICYDGIDQDCAGDVEFENNNDCDGDGFLGRGTDATDCDDTDPLVNPEAEEIWYDGKDQDCDARSDYDQDGDGDAIAEFDCDGDGVFDESCDPNNDGFIDYVAGTDCDDTDPLTSEQFNERLDLVDRNCDALIDNLRTRDANATYYGTGANLDGGLSIAITEMDDWNNDQFLDFAVGAPFSNYNPANGVGSEGFGENPTGMVYVLSPNAEGNPASVALAAIEGSAYSFVGMELATIPDIDGGGLSDLVVGVPGSGAVHVYLSETLAAGGTFSLGDRYTRISGSGTFGVDISTIGDINGDGYAELAAGGSAWSTYIDTNDNAWVGVWDGAAIANGGVLTSGDALYTIESGGSSSLGGETIGGMDLDGDGIPDFIVASAVSSTGKVAMLSGAEVALGGNTAHEDLAQVSGLAGTYFGEHNGLINDLDNDGYAEVAISAAYESANGMNNAGIVYVIDGDQMSIGGNAVDLADWQFQGTEVAANIMINDRSGDLNADGIPDILISQVNENVVSQVLPATVYVFSGADIQQPGTYLATDAHSSIESRETQDMFGATSVVYDIDQDGDDDLLLGGPRYGAVTGSALVFGSGYSLIYYSHLP